MDYTLSLTRHAAKTLETHLLADRSREQMAITLCGVSQLHRELRLLVRDVILLPPDAFQSQTGAHLELKPEVQSFVHVRAYQKGLVQVDWHSHPGSGHLLSFSLTDDRHEAAQAAYLAHRMDGVPYGSVVVNDQALDARLWITHSRRQRGKDGKVKTVAYRPLAHPLQAILVGDLQRRIPTSVARTTLGSGPAHDHSPNASPALSTCFDRQVRAFGQAFQHKLGRLRVGVVGVGGLGSALVDHLARLGVRDWVLVDPDTVELANLNRLVSATVTDAQKARPKVYVARSTIQQSNPKARVRALQADVLDPRVHRVLKACDLLIVATDNHSSRLALNRLAVQYLIPLVHTGFHIGIDENRAKGRAVTDVSGEFAIPELGRWCLECAGIVDPQQAGWELAPTAQREILRQRGYVADTPAPAVRHLDGIVASLAATEVHNLVHAFKPQHRYLTYDALRTELLPLQVTPSNGCLVCSPDHGILGLGDLEPLPDFRRSPQLPALDVGKVRRPGSGLAIAPPLPSFQAPGTLASQPESLQLVSPLPGSSPVPAGSSNDRPTHGARLPREPDGAEGEPEWD